MTLVTKLALYFDDILDTFVIPNTYNLSLPEVKTISASDITYTIEITNLDNNSTLSSSSYVLEQYDNHPFFIIDKFEKGSTLQAYMTAHAGIYKTYAIFNIYVFCGDYCLECSVENTCDICEKGYELDNNLQCVPIVDDPVDSSVYGIAA